MSAGAVVTPLARGLARRPAASLGIAAIHAANALVFAFFFTNADLNLGRAGRLPLPPTLLFPLGVAPLVGLAWAVDPPGFARRLGRILVAQRAVGLAFAASVAISLLWSIAPGANWSAGGTQVFLESYAFGCFALALALAAGGTAARGLRGYVAVAFALLVATVAVDLWVPGTFAKHHSRAAGLGGDPNVTSTLLVMACALLVDPLRPTRREGLLLAVTGATLFATLSRTGFVLYGILVLALGARVGMASGAWRTRRRLVVVLALTAAAVLGTAAVVRDLAERGVGMFAQPATRQRVLMLTGGGDASKLGDSSGEDRLSLLDEHLALAVERPWLGHGTGFSKAQERSGHNRYLRQWTDFGVPGVAVLLALLAAGVLGARACGDPGLALLWLLVAAAGFVDNLVLDNRGVLFALGLRSGAAALSGARR